MIIFGVSGAGKTTLGKLLARKLGWAFYEADDFHSPVNVGKMRAGIPLADEDRWPWLESLRELIKRLDPKEDSVLACSALKHAYRRFLRVNDQVKFVYLRGDHPLIANQLRNRKGHFMNPELLKSQFADLEEPRAAEGILTVDLGRTPRELVQEITTRLGLRE
ncbi:MAG: gluconokinase [Chthoniobacterales bacterium]